MKKLNIFVTAVFLMTNFSYAEDVTQSTGSQQTAEQPMQLASVQTIPGTITFSFKDADIRNVLRLIAAKSGVNIVYGPEVTGMVNMELKDVPWEQALGLILDLNGFAYQRAGNVVKVLKKEDVGKEPLSTAIFSLNYATAKDTVESVKQMLTERGSIKTDARSNTIVVTDVPVNINKIEEVLAKLDRRTHQVLIETKIVSISDNKAKELGLKWTSLKEYTLKLESPTRAFRGVRRGGEGVWDSSSQNVTTDGSNNVITDTNKNDLSSTKTATTINTPTGSTSSDTTTSVLSGISNIDNILTRTLSYSMLNSDIRSAILSADDFELVLSALQTQTDANLISNPRVLTANNEPAQIKVVSEYPIPNYTFDTSTSTFTISGFDYKDIGVVFDVTPNISNDGYVTMKIEPQVSVLLGEIPFTASGATVNIPYIGRKKAMAKLVIKSGDTLAIGGLVDESKKATVTKVPLLGDLPIFGRLFRHDSTETVKSDIIFFITATIIDEDTKKIILKEGMGNVAKEPEDVYKKVFKETKEAPILNTDTSTPKNNKGILQSKKSGKTNNAD